ncbi:MAG: hypothetical protein WB523_17860 [Candidatus Sulfotelmatobacter sp.]
MEPRSSAQTRDGQHQAFGCDRQPSCLAPSLSLFRYVSGDYKDPGTFTAIKKELGSARRPAHYLAIPPSLFETVIEGLGAANLAEEACQTD